MSTKRHSTRLLDCMRTDEHRVHRWDFCEFGEPNSAVAVYTFTDVESGVRTHETIVNAERIGTMTSTRLSTTNDSGCLGGFAYEQANTPSHPLRL